MNYLDLFSGIGGFRLGLEKAGIKFNWEGHSEIDKYANSIYMKHFPESEDLGDVTEINSDKLLKRVRRIDLVTFGFPCQDISVAGKRKGLKGRRSGLFYTAMQIIKVVRPEIFIFENVKGLYSCNGGEDFKAVLETIASLGLYECQWQTLNTRWFLPQNRERIYFVGCLAGTGRQQIFPIGESDSNDEQTQRQFKDGVLCQSLDSSYHKGPDGKRTMIQYGNSQTLNSGHFNQPKVLIQVGLVGEKDNMGQRIYSTEGNACSIRSQGGGQGAKTGLYEVKDERRIRRLTPTECEKLQGFPVGWTEGVSDTQRYRALGNAVTVDVVRAIGERLKI